mgnify:CR=1 FL=1
MISLMKQVKAKSLELMIVALGFVAGGVWKDAIVKWLAGLSPQEGATAMDLTIAALIVTGVVVILIVALTRVLGEKEEEKK